MGLIE